MGSVELLEEPSHVKVRRSYLNARGSRRIVVLTDLIARWKMPKAKLWTIIHSSDDKCLYIKSGEDVRRDYGALVDVRTSKEMEDAVKVRRLI